MAGYSRTNVLFRNGRNLIHLSDDMDFKEAYDDTCSTVGKACRTGNIEALKTLILAGRSVDVKDNRGWFPIHEAAQQLRGTDCLQLLLQHEDTDTNWRTFEGETPLYLASKCGNVNGVRLLLEHRADVNLTTNEQLSPLWEAAKRSDQACMQFLVDAGANVNPQTYTGDTPLHSAAELGDTDIVTYLMDSGADLFKCTDNGLTPVFIAAQFGNHKCLQIMLERADQKGDDYVKRLVDTVANDNATPLLIAAQAGSPECITLLLDKGADPDIACEVESNPGVMPFLPIQTAIYQQQLGCVKLLAPVTTEVEIDWYTCQQCVEWHPVFMAVTFSDISYIRLLLENGYSWQKTYSKFIQNLTELSSYEMEVYRLKVVGNMSFNVTHYFLRSGILRTRMNEIRNQDGLLDPCDTDEVKKLLLSLKYGSPPTILNSHNVNELAVTLIQNIDVRLMYAVIKYGAKLKFGLDHSWYPQEKELFWKRRIECCRLYFIVLCLCSNLRSDEETRINKGIAHRQAYAEKVEQIQEASWSLRHACRVNIVRQLIHVGRYTDEHVRCLQIPSVLEDYLLYRDFDDEELCDGEMLYSIGRDMVFEFGRLQSIDKEVDIHMSQNEVEFRKLSLP